MDHRYKSFCLFFRAIKFELRNFVKFKLNAAERSQENYFHLGNTLCWRRLAERMRAIFLYYLHESEYSYCERDRQQY